MRAWWSLVVGAPERRQLAEQISAFVGELGRAQPVHGVGSRLLADLLELVADLVDGLVPFDAGPLAVDHLHRIFQAAFAHHQFAHRGALGAMRAAIDRTIPARLLADPDAVGDFRRDGAADRAMRADAFADGHGRALGGRRTGFGLLHARKRQGAERGEAAGGETRPAQESAAVEAFVVLAGEGGEMTAARLTFCSLDQHGVPPSARITVDAVIGLHLG